MNLRSVNFLIASVAFVVVILFVIWQRQDRQAEVTGDVEWVIPASQIESFQRRALAGDNQSAHSLANHFRAQSKEDEALRWFAVAGERGDCAAILMLADSKAQSRDDLAHWQAQALRHGCNFESAYGRNGE